MTKKIFAIILVFIYFSACQTLGVYELNREINGIITDKFVDDKNHHSSTISIQSFDGKIEYIDALEFSGIWEYTDIGDTLIKKPKKSTLKVKKVNGKEKGFDFTVPAMAFHIGCN